MDGKYLHRSGDLSNGVNRRGAVALCRETRPLGREMSGSVWITRDRLVRRLAGFLLVVAVCGCGPGTAPTDTPGEEPSAAIGDSTTTTERETTALVPPPTSLSTIPDDESSTPITQPETPTAALTLETLTLGIELPWQWGHWTVDEFGYSTEFSVRYDGDHLFGIYPFGETVPLTGDSETSLGEEAIRAELRGRLNGDGFSHTIEPVEFFGQPALLSVWVSPAEGPTEDAFVELYFRRAGRSWAFLSASSHEWDDIDARAVAAFATVFREFIAAFAHGPGAASSLSPPPVDALGEVPSGKLCGDLSAAGFSYREAVAYWMSEGMPATMDADGNGVPCEAVYPAFAVEIVYGDPTWPNVEFVITVADDGNRRFTATGGAVDAGVVCPSGTAYQIEAADWGWVDEYVCTDATGGFTIELRDHLHVAEVTCATWSIDLAGGSGAYEYLHAGGGAASSITPAGHQEDHLYGRIAINPVG